jgi:hypothetical protein
MEEIMSQWIKSKYDRNATRWKVKDCAYNEMSMDDWCVDNPTSSDVAMRYHWLPKSEYILCDPPTEWEECTRERVQITDSGNLQFKGTEWAMRKDERWAWNGDALVVQRIKTV